MSLSRRTFIGISGVVSLPALASKPSRIHITHGCSVGEVDADSALIWCRSNSAAQAYVDVSISKDFKQIDTFRGSVGLADNDFNCKTELHGLQSNTRYYFRVYCQSLSDTKQYSAALDGQFLTAALGELENIRFCWSGDTVGQGYGIDPAHGGMLTYYTMLKRKPDFFVHSGDQIYADNPLAAIKNSPDGRVWKNYLTLGKAKVAETTQDFRENYYYNFHDEHLRNFHRQVPVYHMWDDHEVLNNWYPGEMLDDDRYSEKSVSILAARARRAFVECLPVAHNENRGHQFYRHVSRGPLLDLFMVDLRSYRAANNKNRQTEVSDETEFWGGQQLQWLKQSLKNSKGLWKIVCIDMPLSVRVNEWGTDIAENAANGEGPALGRELEYKELLEFIHSEKIANVHFITADVHYCASYYFHPDTAIEKNFTPFWEFISGPLHAGTFGPGEIDPTFGPVAKFIGLPDEFAPGASPAENLQFFGEIDIDAKSKTLSVRHINRVGDILWEKTLSPVL